MSGAPLLNESNREYAPLKRTLEIRRTGRSRKPLSLLRYHFRDAHMMTKITGHLRLELARVNIVNSRLNILDKMYERTRQEASYIERVRAN